MASRDRHATDFKGVWENIFFILKRFSGLSYCAGYLVNDFVGFFVHSFHAIIFQRLGRETFEFSMFQRLDESGSQFVCNLAPVEFVPHSIHRQAGRRDVEFV